MRRFLRFCLRSFAIGVAVGLLCGLILFIFPGHLWSLLMLMVWPGGAVLIVGDLPKGTVYDYALLIGLCSLINGGIYMAVGGIALMLSGAVEGIFERLSRLRAK